MLEFASSCSHMRDIDIRRELRREMTLQHGRDPETLVVEELGLCQGLARVDLAVINGSIHGYEIKSEQDTLNRLPGQTQTYNRVFDYVTVVTSRKHADKIAKMVPNWWGISIAVPAESGVLLIKKRQAKKNRKTDSFALAQLLWRDEAIDALVSVGVTGIKSKPRQLLWRRLSLDIPQEELGRIIRTRLKQRSTRWRAPSQLTSGDGLSQPSAK